MKTCYRAGHLVKLNKQESTILFLNLFMLTTGVGTKWFIRNKTVLDILKPADEILTWLMNLTDILKANRTDFPDPYIDLACCLSCTY